MTRERELPDFDGPSRNQSKEFNRKAKLTVDIAQVQAGLAAKLIEELKEAINEERDPATHRICRKLMGLILRSEFNLRLAKQVGKENE